MSRSYIVELRRKGRTERIGNKAKNLYFLTDKGFEIPRTLVCTWDAYVRYLQGDPEIVEVLADELSRAIDPNRWYAVRSSANFEDSPGLTFAGQFKSVLNVKGVSDILHAIWSIWATTQSAGVRTYLEQHAIDPSELRMAIMIQDMVSPIISGIAFSKNPMTGLDEIVVEAVKGSGEALLQDGVTPTRWINKWGSWILTPENDGGTGIELDLIQEVVDQTKAISKAYGQPVDLEWVFDGQLLHWVQLRQITKPDINIYSNHISKEVFPGIIKPLVWTVNVPLVNGAWVQLFTELIGHNDIDPLSLAKSFYYRAYFNMGAIGRIFETLGMPPETLELLTGIETGGPDKPSFTPSPKTYTLLPRMLAVALKKLRFARQIDAFLPAAEAQYEAAQAKQLGQLDERALLHEIDRLYDLTQETAYFNIVTPLLMQIYSRALQRQLSRNGVDTAQFDLTKDLKALEAFDPTAHLDTLMGALAELDPELQTRISECSYEEFCELPGAESLREEFDAFINQFGHLSDSGNDFSSIPWREDPDLVLKMLGNYKSPEDTSATKIGFEELKMSKAHRWLLRPIYRRARQFRQYREAISSLYTRGYGLFRDHFFALGERFVERGIIREREDILFLRFDEVRHIVENHHPDVDYEEKIAKRKQDMMAAQVIAPPSIIYGDEAPPVERHAGNRLQGTPTSRGYYTGPVRVIQGIRDMGRLRDGDVLVIPFSDVGWTPLFTKAGGVIAESGGILSHSSIVAREYNIPAVVSVSGACQLKDDTVVTVDGYRGEVVVHTTRRYSD